MSYINEALKKVQKERDARHLRYGGVLAARGKEGRGSGRRAVRLTVLLLVLLAVGYSAYSLLETEGQKSPSSPRPQRRAASPKPEKTPRAAMLYKKARDLHKGGRLQDARRWYEETLSLDPGHVDALNNLGVIYIYQKNYVAARRSFEKATRLKPTYVDSYYNLACLYAIQGKISPSLKNLKKAVSLDESVRDWAQRDNDLENLKEVPEFAEILGMEINDAAVK